eukprot:826288_1
MATLNSFGLSFCCILYLILTSSNGSIYNNEICFSENWMPIVIGGSSWSWTTDSNSCSLTSDMNTHNMAMLAYKSWPYLNNAQDPSYTLEIEYNFTITAASGNNTIGSAGILWFFDSQTFDYIGVSFKRNEAFAGVISGIDAKVHYNNLHLSFDDSEVIELNRGALPFTLSMGTFYSMRVEVYNIWRGIIRYDIYLNGQYINHFSTYSNAFEQNTSWIGLKNTDAAVISHALTVHQPSTIDDGNGVIQYFESSNAVTTTTGIIETTDHSTTANTPLVIHDIITTSNGIAKVTDHSDAQDHSRMFGMDINLILLIIGVTVGGYLLCCCVWILVLWHLPKKKRKSQYIQQEGEADVENEVPNINDIGFRSNATSYDNGNVLIPTRSGGVDHLKPIVQHNMITLERMGSEGVERGIFCTKCHTVIQDGSAFMNHGMTYCNECSEDVKQELAITRKTPRTKTKRTPKSPNGDRCDKCVDCGGKEKGRTYEDDGCFYCNKCWENYENDEELFINKSDDNTVSGTNNYIQ